MKYLKALLLIITSIFLIDVNAIDYNPYDSIPITSVNANIKSKTFNYNGVTYNSGLDETNSPYFTFSGIHNNTNKKIPVTVAIGLFDNQGKNIGTIFYCTKRDYDSKYSGLEVKANSSVSFKISAKKKYFVSNRSANEIASYAILSDNKDCEAAGFTKYQGLTLAEIQDGIKPETEVPEKKTFDLLNTISGNLMIGMLILVVIVSFIAYIFYCLIINNLYKKMYNTASSLVFVPIVNTFICVKLAFGPLISIIWLVLFVLSILLSIFKIPFVSIIASILSFLAFVACIIKLITKQYALFYYDPNVKKETKKKKETSKFINNSPSTNENAIKQNLLKGNEESLLDETGADSFKIDLNYSQSDVDQADNDYFDISAGINDESTGATKVETTNDVQDSKINDIVSFMDNATAPSNESKNAKDTASAGTTDFSSLLDLNDEDDSESQFDEDLPDDE